MFALYWKGHVLTDKNTKVKANGSRQHQEYYVWHMGQAGRGVSGHQQLYLSRLELKPFIEAGHVTAVYSQSQGPADPARHDGSLTSVCGYCMLMPQFCFWSIILNTKILHLRPEF